MGCAGSKPYEEPNAQTIGPQHVQPPSPGPGTHETHETVLIKEMQPLTSVAGGLQPLLAQPSPAQNLPLVQNAESNPGPAHQTGLETQAQDPNGASHPAVEVIVLMPLHTAQTTATPEPMNTPGIVKPSSSSQPLRQSRHQPPRKIVSQNARWSGGTSLISQECGVCETVSGPSSILLTGDSVSITGSELIQQFSYSTLTEDGACSIPDRRAGLASLARNVAPPSPFITDASALSLQGSTPTLTSPSQSASDSMERSLSAGSAAGGAGGSAAVVRPVALKQPSRLSLAAGPRQMQMDLGIQREPPCSLTTPLPSSKLGPSSSMSQSSQMVTLHKTVESLLLQDADVFRKVHASMRGISSLAKETNNLEVARDATGATTINQYVVVKTLGRGAFGKVKLCLNTMDGVMYAVKMVNRSFIVKQLQKPAKSLRRRVPTRTTSNNSRCSLGGGAVRALSTEVPCTSPGSNSGTDMALAPRSASLATVHSFQESNKPRRNSNDEMGSAMESVMREIAVLKKMDHPNVVKLLEVIDPPGQTYMMLVMEFMERGPVQETAGQQGFKSFPERTARDYFRQACSGLDYLHYNNVVHGDLKPENLLVTAAGVLKIGDFGSARIMSPGSGSSSKVSCTPAFQPPEAMSGSTFAEDPELADVWALGVCLYSFIFGRLPFTGSCLLDMSNAIRTEEVKYPSAVDISPELRDLISRMLSKDPRGRITLMQLMAHSWVTDQDRMPLASLHTLLTPPKMVEVSHNEAQSAIGRDTMVNMIRARLKEKIFKAGEFMFHQFEEAHCIFMIMSGVVELTCQLIKREELKLADDAEQQSFSVDMDESFTLCDGDNLMPTGLNIVNGKLHIDRARAEEMKQRMRNVMMARQTEYVTELKGPGQVIGEVGLDKSQVARHTHSARARGSVTVVKLTEESFLKALMAQMAETGTTTSANNIEDAELYSMANIIDEEVHSESQAAHGSL